MAERKCTACGSKMMPAWVPGDDETGPLVEIDGCIKCGATWFDAGELEQIAAKVIVDWYASDEEAQNRCWSCGTVVDTSGPFVRPGPKTCPKCKSLTGRACPACTAHMSVLEHQGILIDVCPRCKGIFLDAGEYDRILAAPGEPLDCVSCKAVVPDPRRGYFSENGILCETCHKTTRPAEDAPEPGLRRTDVSRFLSEYLRRRGKPSAER